MTRYLEKMNNSTRAKASPPTVGLLVLLAAISFGAPAPAQTVYVVDQFNPSGIGTNERLGQLVRRRVSIVDLGFHQRRQQ